MTVLQIDKLTCCKFTKYQNNDQKQLYFCSIVKKIYLY